MAKLTIRNLPDDLYARLEARAAKHRRSLDSEAIRAIEQALNDPPRADVAQLLATLRRSRARLGHIHVTDATLCKHRSAGRRAGPGRTPRQ